MAGPELFTVLDTTAVLGQGDRTHELLLDSGELIQYTFSPNKALSMPAPHALKFARHDAFIVKNQDGHRVRNAPAMPKVTDAPATRLTLKPDQTIARFDELSTDALLTRALMTPGGEGFKKATGREAMIEFLMKANKRHIDTENAKGEKMERSRAADGSLGGGDLDDMSMSEIDGLLGDIAGKEAA